MRIEEGHIYRIDTSLNPENRPCGTFGKYHSFNGTELTLDEIEDTQLSGFRFKTWWFAYDVLVDTGKRTETGVEKRTYLDFKVGDLVKIRSKEDMKIQYGTRYGGEIKTNPCSFTPEMQVYCGKEAVLTEVNGNRVRLYFKNYKERSRYSFCKDMLEIVEEGYRDRIMKENEKLKLSKEETKDDEIIKEMISKVDVDKIRKMLAGALRVKGTSLNGLDQLLENWAYAKKDIYLLFGRNLKLIKPIEYEMSEQDASTNKEMFLEKFHRLCKNVTRNKCR